MLSYAPCGPQGTCMRYRTPRTVGAAHRSAAIAWGARPVPFRTRKLSPIAPRVLRGQPVGGQGAADRWTAPGRRMTLRRGRPRGLPLFALYKPTFTLSVLGVFGLALVEGIVVVRGEVEPIFLLMSLSGGAQSAPGFCRHVYPDGFFAPYSSKSIKRHCFNQIHSAIGGSI